MWISNLRMNDTNMTQGQRQAAQYIVDCQDSIEGITLRQCALGAGVGQPTVLRMLEKCGYVGWKEFQETIREERIRAQSADVTYHHKQKHNTTLQAIADDVKMLQYMADHLKTADIKAVVKGMERAKIIDIYGTDNSANAANELAGRLLHLGLPSRNYPDLFFQKVGAGHLNEKDVAIGFSLLGETLAVIETLEAAKKRGAMTVAVTSDTQSTLAKLADYVFETPTIIHDSSQKWIASRIAQIVIVDVLCTALIEGDTERYTRELDISYEEFQGDVSERAKQSSQE